METGRVRVNPLIADRNSAKPGNQAPDLLVFLA
jgi:hypothetical protein